MKTQKQINDGGSVTADLISERYVAGIGMLEEKVKSVGGLSIRDYFAAAALQGNLASQSNEAGIYTGGDCWEKAAKDSYRAADAMLAARKGGA